MIWVSQRQYSEDCRTQGRNSALACCKYTQSLQADYIKLISLTITLTFQDTNWIYKILISFYIMYTDLVNWKAQLFSLSSMDTKTNAPIMSVLWKISLTSTDYSSHLLLSGSSQKTHILLHFLFSNINTNQISKIILLQNINTQLR